MIEEEFSTKSWFGNKCDAVFKKRSERKRRQGGRRRFSRLPSKKLLSIAGLGEEACLNGSICPR